MRVWTVSEVKAGTLTQCLGVGRHFDSEPHSVIVKKKLRWWAKGPLSPYGRLEQPEPDLLISCGSMAPKHVFAIAERCRKKPFTVHLQTPQDEFVQRYDLAFIGRHDWNAKTAAEKHFHQMIGAPHQITTVNLGELRDAARAKWAPEGRRIVSVLVGGPTEAYVFDAATVDSLIGTITRFAEEGHTVLVSTSRRSHPDMLPRLLAAQSDAIRVWDRTGSNPYREFLAAADVVMVTEDSVTMACEALSTTRPVYIFGLPGIASAKYDKFQRFHRDLSETLGLTRPFEMSLDDYSYAPPDESRRIAGVIAAEMALRGIAPTIRPGS